MIKKNKINQTFWQDKRVLVTGHTGFKGSWLVLWLKNLGSNVCGISLENNDQFSLFSSLKLKSKIDTNYFHDINEFDKTNSFINSFQPEIVFHLAAQSLVRKGYDDPLQTWKTNVIGSLNILESLKNVKKKCVVIMVTTDKVYENKEIKYSYKETDQLGGYDPYSASKAACEIAISSWRNSFCGNKNGHLNSLHIATARSGNVIGGGDWAENRIVPDAVKALMNNEVILVRNPASERPWQHVLEPLHGYMLLAQKIYQDNNSFFQNDLNKSFNFGPISSSNKNVSSLVEEILKHWNGDWIKDLDLNSPHEAKYLHLNIDKATNILGWQPMWTFKETIEKTILWYKKVHEGGISEEDACLENIYSYMNKLEIID